MKMSEPNSRLRKGIIWSMALLEADTRCVRAPVAEAFHRAFPMSHAWTEQTCRSAGAFEIGGRDG
jgi:hypothetical protein